MKHGNWIPISKALAKKLPKKRQYSEVEAAFSLQLDYDCGNMVTISGCSKRWGWSRKKVRRFYKDMGAEIFYADDTKKKQNQKGQIRGQIRDRKGTDKEQIRLINPSTLQTGQNRNGTETGQIGDRSGDTTINPIEPNPYPNPKIKKEPPKFFQDLATKFYQKKKQHTKARLQFCALKWAETLHKLSRIDEYPNDLIEKVVMFTFDSDFWKTNLLSLASLRVKGKNGLIKFTNILADYENNGNGKKPYKSKNIQLIERNMAAGEKALAYLEKLEDDNAG